MKFNALLFIKHTRLILLASSVFTFLLLIAMVNMNNIQAVDEKGYDLQKIKMEYMLYLQMDIMSCF